mmetsp:Transcript_7561/g.14407  ORF Transcript_7561/g.14407 Transcript_7561/m.14407 type:complete len:204 (+) Transcript_7561:596-1207(+)
MLIIEVAFTKCRIIKGVLIRWQCLLPQRRNIMLSTNVCHVQVIGLRRKLSSKRVNLLDNGQYTPGDTHRNHIVGRTSCCFGKLPIAEAKLLASAQKCRSASLQLVKAFQGLDVALASVNGVQLCKEPRVDLCYGMDFGHGLALLERMRNGPETKGPWVLQFIIQCPRVFLGLRANVPSLIKTVRTFVNHSQRLLDGLLKGPAN